MTELSKRLRPIGVAAALVVVAIVVPATLDAIFPDWITAWIQDVGLVAATALVLIMVSVGLGIWAWAIFAAGRRKSS